MLGSLTSEAIDLATLADHLSSPNEADRAWSRAEVLVIYDEIGDVQPLAIGLREDFEGTPADVQGALGTAVTTLRTAIPVIVNRFVMDHNVHNWAVADPDVLKGWWRERRVLALKNHREEPLIVLIPWILVPQLDEVFATAGIAGQQTQAEPERTPALV